jgi:hypothetical protein
VVKRRLRVKTKFKYFRRGFLKHLKNTAFAFKRSRKLLRTTLFVEKKKFRPRKSSRKSFRFGKSLFLLKLSLGLLLSKVQRTNNPRIIKQGILFFCKKKNYPFRLDNPKVQVFYKMQSFLRANNFQFSLKKKLNLRRQKVFFYSVHIAAPKKKSKKISLFGLKNMYYKKISLFFGFKKTSRFFKACANAKKI